jgi:NADP-dependent 3-hydroxy acid dehydrogenase YdfG
VLVLGLASVVVHLALTQPPHVDVNEILVRPVNQPF